METIKKGKTTFENAQAVPAKLHKLLAQLKEDKYLADLPYEDFIQQLAYYFSELNYIHPFREGNGRATREFIRLLLERNGYVVNWSAVGVTMLMDAMIESVYDTNPLVAVLRACVTTIKQ